MMTIWRLKGDLDALAAVYYKWEYAVVMEAEPYPGDSKICASLEDHEKLAIAAWRNSLVTKSLRGVQLHQMKLDVWHLLFRCVDEEHPALQFGLTCRSVCYEAKNRCSLSIDCRSEFANTQCTGSADPAVEDTFKDDL